MDKIISDIIEFDDIDTDFPIIEHEKVDSKKKDKKPKAKKNKKSNSKIEHKVKEDKTQESDKAPKLDLDKINTDTKLEDITSKNVTGSFSAKQVMHKALNTPALNTNNKFIKAVSETNTKKYEQEKLRIESSSSEYPYVAKPLVTSAELQLYHFMDNNLIYRHKFIILTKVRIADLMDVDDLLVNSNEAKKKAFYKIAMKHVDFVIADAKTLNIVCVVELDDYTHDRAEVQERDKFVYWAMKAANIKYTRIKTKIDNITKADLRPTERFIAEYYAIDCPYCGLPTEYKERRQGARAGHRFYGCTGFPKCSFTMDIDNW